MSTNGGQEGRLVEAAVRAIDAELTWELLDASSVETWSDAKLEEGIAVSSTFAAFWRRFIEDAEDDLDTETLAWMRDLISRVEAWWSALAVELALRR